MTPTFAKDRARLLRQDLAAAGFDVTHSLALELVAHQHGFVDWNTLAATDGWRRPAEPYVELEAYEHVSSTLTVGELRSVIKGHPDAMAVVVSQPGEPGSTTSSVMLAGSVVVQPSMTSNHRPALEIEGTYATGRYLVPRRLAFEVSGLPVGGGPVVADLIDSVQTAVEDLGFRGERSMNNDLETGTVVWTFQAYEGMPLSAAEDAVRRVVRRLDPGTWTLATG